MKYTVNRQNGSFILHLIYTFILLYSIVLEIKAIKHHRHDFSVSKELLSAYTTAKTVSSEEIKPIGYVSSLLLMYSSW